MFSVGLVLTVYCGSRAVVIQRDLPELNAVFACDDTFRDLSGKEGGYVEMQEKLYAVQEKASDLQEEKISNRLKFLAGSFCIFGIVIVLLNELLSERKKSG